MPPFTEGFVWCCARRHHCSCREHILPLSSFSGAWGGGEWGQAGVRDGLSKVKQPYAARARPKLDVSPGVWASRAPALFHSPVLSAIPVGASGAQGLHCTHWEGAPAQFPKGQEGNCQDTVPLLSFLKKNILQRDIEERGVSCCHL